MILQPMGRRDRSPSPPVRSKSRALRSSTAIARLGRAARRRDLLDIDGRQSLPQTRAAGERASP